MTQRPDTAVHRMPTVVRLLADYTDTSPRAVRYHPVTGQAYLADPATGDPNPWPLAGMEFVGEPPAHTRVPHRWVYKGIAEGWITAAGERPVHRPGGPPDDPWRLTHTFRHFDTLTFNTVGGPVHYRVARNPDKYVTGAPDDAPVTPDIYAAGQTDVTWVYDLDLVTGG